MVFVWSRLALAAVLAAGAACAPAEASADLAAAPCACEHDGPRLVCADGASFVLFADAQDRSADALAAVAAGTGDAPRVAAAVADTRVPAPPTARGDVLAVAPKTSPPQT